MRWVRNGKEQLVVFSSFYGFFLLTLVANFSGPHDSINYLNGLVSGKQLFHQHHLLYHFITHYWLVFIQRIFPGIKDYYLVESFTAIWGSCNVVLVYNFFRNRFSLNVLTAAIGCTIVAFSYGMWLYSVNIEVYAPPMFFILLSLYIMTKEEFRKSDVWIVGLLHSLAVLFHQINILFFIVVLYKFWEQRKKIRFGDAVMKYLFTGIVLVGGLYFLVGWIIERHHTFASWTTWIQGYAIQGTYWQSPSLTTVLHVLTGSSHAIIGGHFLFEVPYVNHTINNSFGPHSLDDEMFLSRKLSPAIAIVLTILTLIVALFMIVLVIRFVKNYRKIHLVWKRVTIPLLLCLGVYSVFFCFWIPEILEFWILQSVLLWVLLIGTLPETGFPFRINRITVLLTLSLFLFTINFFGSVLWLLDINNDLYYRKIEKIKESANKKDIIILQDAWILGDFLRYFTRAQILETPVGDSLRTNNDRKIRETLASHGKIYIYPEHHSKYIVPDTRYIDSLRLVYRGRIQIYHDKDPSIFVIE